MQLLQSPDPGILDLNLQCPATNSLENRRDGVVVRASQSVNLGFISKVESYQTTLKKGIHSFPAWHSAQKKR